MGNKLKLKRMYFLHPAAYGAGSLVKYGIGQGLEEIGRGFGRSMLGEKGASYGKSGAESGDLIGGFIK